MVERHGNHQGRRKRRGHVASGVVPREKGLPLRAAEIESFRGTAGERRGGARWDCGGEEVASFKLSTMVEARFSSGKKEEEPRDAYGGYPGETRWGEHGESAGERRSQALSTQQWWRHLGRRKRSRSGASGVVRWVSGGDERERGRWEMEIESFKPSTMVEATWKAQGMKTSKSGRDREHRGTAGEARRGARWHCGGDKTGSTVALRGTGEGVSTVGEEGAS